MPNLNEFSIGVNLISLRSSRNVGVEEFAKNVVAGMPVFNKCRIAISQGFSFEKICPRDNAFDNQEQRITRFPDLPTPLRILLEMVVLPFSFYNCDAVVSINNFGPIFGKKNQKRLIVIHDVWYLSKYFEGKWFDKMVFKTLMKIQLLSTHHVITVSEFSKREIQYHLEVKEQNITVVHNCISRLGKRTKNSREVLDEYFLLIGSDRENKNVRRTIDGYLDYVKGNSNPLRLVIVGPYSDTFKKSCLAKFSNLENVMWLGYVTRDSLDGLMSNSRGVIFVSLYEGFGIPVIESISMGKPLLVSKETVCKELGGDACIDVDGTDPLEISDGFKKLEEFDLSKIDQLSLTPYDCKNNSQIFQNAIYSCYMQEI